MKPKEEYLKRLNSSFLFICLFIILTMSSCKKNDSYSGIIEGTISECDDSLILVQLHPNVILDTIKIFNGKFTYKYPTVNYKRVSMTPESKSYQRGWCRSDKFRIVKMFLVGKNGKLKQITFQNSFFDRPYSFDAIVLDNSKIRMSISGNDISHTIIQGSSETDRIFKSIYDGSDQDRYYKLTLGKINDFAVIKEFSNNRGLAKKIFDDRELYSVDSLQSIYELLNTNVKKSKYGQELRTYIKKKQMK